MCIKNLITILVIFFVLLSSCSTSEYIKTGPNVPVFDTAKQLNMGLKLGSIVEYQGSFSFNKTIGVFGGMSLGVAIPENKNYYYEGGICFTKKSKKDFISLAIGTGIGKYGTSWEFGLYPTYSGVELDYNYRSLIIQPSIGFIYPEQGWSNIFTLRVENLNYGKFLFKDYERDVSGDENWKYKINIDDNDVKSIRFGLYYTAMKSHDKVDTFFQFGINYPISLDFDEDHSEFKYKPRFFTRVGFIIPIKMKK